MVLAVPMLTPIYVLAEGTSGTSDSTTSTSSSTETDKTTLAKELADRLQARKTELKIKLTSVEKLRIQSKCQASQGLISSVKGRIKGIETSRAEVYKNLVDRLTDLSTKLKNKGADTTALDADITALKALITTYNTDLTAYKQAVSDLVDVDCKTDPDGFKASLEAARAALAKVSKDAIAIRSDVNDTIKPLLKTIRTSLETTKTGGSN